MGELTHDGVRFVFVADNRAEWSFAVDAGFTCVGTSYTCYARDLVVAAKLRAFATAKVKRTHFRCLIEVSPWLVPLPLPPPGLALKKHQPRAIRFALERNRSFLRLDPGLGKTVVAAMIAVARGGRVLYVTPPGLAPNVESELAAWAPHLITYVVSGGSELSWPFCDVLIVPDSLIGREAVHTALKWWAATSTVAATVIVDEAHRFKNDEAQRTRGLFAAAEAFDVQTYMSGTPLPNRPIELYPILNFAAPETISFRSKHRYGVRYCGGFFDGFGYNFKGSSNMSELRRRLLKDEPRFMLRMTKKILGLPPKTEGVLVVGHALRGEVAALDRDARAEYGDKVDKLIEAGLAAKIGRSKIPMATYRRLLGVAKVPHVVDHVKRLLEDGYAVLVFAQHLEVVALLAEKLGRFKPYVITGATPKKKRKEQVDDFQRNKRRPLFIGNITAMGEGNTLTKAERVVIAEPDWVPGKNTQAGDRAHRIGQTRAVHVDYVVFRNSLDKVVIENVLKKRQAISYL